MIILYDVYDLCDMFYNYKLEIKVYIVVLIFIFIYGINLNYKFFLKIIFDKDLRKE